MNGAIACGTCPHVRALHRARGACRINGCPCVAFSEVAAPSLELEPVQVLEPSRVLVVATRVAAAAISFIAGILVGQNL